MLLLNQLQDSCNFQFFVETGTFNGDTVDAVKPHFNKVYSVELSEILYKAAKKRFIDDDKVEIFHGDSSEILKNISAQLSDETVLYWLDAHWCVADNTSGDKSQCPLLNEIKNINTLNGDSVILIDDARLFMAPPAVPHDVTQWPDLSQVINSLQSISSQHEIMIVNDVIAFYPQVAKESIIRYARDCGVDWLDAANANVPRGEDCGYLKFIKTIDVLVMGRKTYGKYCLLGCGHMETHP